MKKIISYIAYVIFGGAVGGGGLREGRFGKKKIMINV